MTTRAWGFTLAMVAFGATALQATQTDPQGILDQLVPGAGPAAPVDPFSLGADASGGGVYNFQNASNKDWIALDFFVILPQDSSIGTLPNPFFANFHVTSTNLSLGGMCDGLIATSTGLACYDFGWNQPINGGIPSAQTFAVNLNDLIDGQQNYDPTGPGGWGSFTDINAVETDAAPEPASWLLMGPGIIALLGLLLRFRRRTSSNASPY